MNNKLKPALIGGVLLGVLSVIPFVSAVNVCCCLWAILGGALASYLYIKNSPTPVSAGDGAALGAMAGVVGGVIYLILGVPISIAMGPTMQRLMVSLVENIDAGQAEMIRQQLEGAETSIVSVILKTLLGSVLLLVFSVVGGLIAIPIFEKRKAGPPPPPPNMGGAPGGFAG
jgi:hypothetical protein